MESADFAWTVMAIRIQREVGGNLAELLLNVAATLREREYLRRQVKSLSAEGRFSAYILLGLPVVVIGYMMLSNPVYVQPLISTPDRMGDARGHGRPDGAGCDHHEQADQGGGLMATTTIVLMLGITGIFAGIFISLAAIGVFTNEERGISKSLVVLDAFSNAPPPCRRSSTRRSTTGCSPRCSPASTTSARRLTPHRLRRADPAQAGRGRQPVGWNVDRIVSLKVIGIGIGAFVGLLVALLFGAGTRRSVGVMRRRRLLGYYAPNLYVYQKGYDRTQQMQRATCPTPSTCSSISVEAGLGFDAALAQVARNTDGPLADEFARVLQEMQIGLGRASALRALGERSHLADLRAFASAMVQADAFGIPIGQVLRVQSERDAGQAPAAGRGGGPEGAGQDHDPAGLLHPALPLHRGPRARGNRHDGAFGGGGALN